MSTTATETTEKPVTRALLDSVTVRDIDEEQRRATFVAATENGVQTWQGPEHLRMGGADLTRYRKNPVVLDTHNRWEVGAVIGNATVKTAKRELIAEVTFAETERATEAWQLISGGFVSALSIGFIPLEVEIVSDGEVSGRGENRIEGPARIVRQWELFEISVVPVPADADALKRMFFATDGLAELRDLVCQIERHVQALTGATEQRHSQMEVSAMDTNDKPTAAPATEEGATTETATERVLLEPETEEETLRRRLMAVTPKALHEFAESVLLKGGTFEEMRAVVQAEHAQRAEAVGTPAPTQGKRQDAGRDEPKMADVSSDQLARALNSL